MFFMKIDFTKAFCKRNAFLQELMQGHRSFFSFGVEDGRRIASSQCPSRLEERKTEANADSFRLVYSLADTGGELHIYFKVFHDFPYFEYVPFFRNSQRKERTAVIDRFLPLDISGEIETPYYGKMRIKDWDLPAGNRLKVCYYMGSFCCASDFLKQERLLFPRPGENRLHLGSLHCGRSSESALPFFRIDFDDSFGLDVGIGWSGNWMADIELKCLYHDDDVWQAGKEWQLSCGMPESRFYLEPEEELRAPACFLGFRDGISVRDFINVHRHFMMTHHAPHDSAGKLLVPPLSAASWGGVESENMKKIMTVIRTHDLPFEVHWIDAGWMGKDAPCPHFCDVDGEKSDWGTRVGSLHINSYAHPNGLCEVSEYAREMGLKTLLWFEPERFCANCGSPLLTEHPDWFLKADQSNYLLDLGNPDARESLTKTILDFLEREKIDHFRQDFNINPYNAWKSCEKPDRVGVTEMKYIDGLYRFWHDLRSAHPDMFIDNCASGGRRLDYMLADYSFPLCQSDYATFMEYNYTCVQLENYYLNEVYPLHSSLSWMPEGDLYAAFSGGCGVGIGSKLWQFPSRYPDKKFDYDGYRKVLLAIRRIRDLLLTGNYYPLTPNAQDLAEFCAMQFHDSEMNSGCLLIFRRPETPETEFQAVLQEIQPEKNYFLYEFGAASPQTITGKELRRFHTELSIPRSVRLYFYEEVAK